METDKNLLLILFKDFSRRHTITSLAKELKLSRAGTWKILKKLKAKKYVTIETIGPSKTSITISRINWDNIIVEKALSLYLTEESVKQKRWLMNFAELEEEVEFLIIYGSILTNSKQANDIDIMGIVKNNKFVKIQQIVDKIQKTQTQKIHMINFTETEFRTELKNDAFKDVIKTGVVLFGQENFIRFMKNG